jgi:hypothetical protein
MTHKSGSQIIMPGCCCLADERVVTTSHRKWKFFMCVCACFLQLIVQSHRNTPHASSSLPVALQSCLVALVLGTVPEPPTHCRKEAIKETLPSTHRVRVRVSVA